MNIRVTILLLFVLKQSNAIYLSSGYSVVEVGKRTWN